MKNNYLKNKAFTLVECIFAVFVLSIISLYILSGINNFLQIQKANIKEIDELSEIETTIVLIKSNIKSNKSILENVNSEKFEVKVSDFGELYNIKIYQKDNVEKIYEFYVSK